jgi:hypothetical protein
MNDLNEAGSRLSLKIRSFMKLSLSNLDPATTPADIAAHFAPHAIGHLSRIHTIANVGKTLFKTYCFLELDARDQEEQTILQYNGSTLLNAVISVKKGQ